MQVIPPPAFSLLPYIYRGPQVDDEGKLDDRVWFFIATGINLDDETASFLIFPHGASEEEIKEVSFTREELMWTE